ncbi:MAG TPA: glycosyltransferase [Alphaproteobacteria bacterium]|nr:glycosyltransferase [Alphaproteobacteria bacterium]
MAGAAYGGAEAFFMRLVPALARAGLEQRIVMRADPARAAQLHAQGLDPVQLGFGGILDFTTTPALQREIEDFAPDIVLTWMSRATRHCPKGRFIHIARLGGYYDLKYYRHCDYLIGNTADIVEYIRRGGWPRDRVHYLPNFVDITPASPSPRGMFDTPEGTPLLLALGRLHDDKAFDVLLPALAELPGVYCWLAGDGPERAALEAQAERLALGDRLRFLGWRQDVGGLYAAADILVCPSRREPLGNVVIEAWARNVPVVAAASEGPGALIRDGVSGLLVPVNDAVALARAIRRVIDDPGLASRLGEGGSVAYAADYTEQAVVARYLAFFDRVAA